MARAGWEITAVASRSAADARALAARVRAPLATTDPSLAAATAGAVLIAVPDREIAAVAESLAHPRRPLSVAIRAVPTRAVAKTARQPFRRATPAPALVASAPVAPPGRVALHLSGASGAEALNPLRRLGWKTGSLHPFLSFPSAPARRSPTARRGGLKVRSRRSAAATVGGSPSTRFGGAAFGVDGDADAIRLARALAHSLGGRVRLVPARDRVAWHLAASYASNYVVAIAAEAVSLLGAVGLGPREGLATLLPLLRSSLAGLESEGLPRALTGAVARGDAGTVARHARLARRRSPASAALHRALVLRALEVALDAGWLGRAARRRILDALDAR